MSTGPQLTFEAITHYMMEINQATCRTILLGLVLGTLVLVMGHAVFRHPDARPRTKYAAGAVVLTAVLLAVVKMNLYALDIQTAVAHGLYDTTYELEDLARMNRHTPAESTLPQDLNGALIIYYRYGCPDCETVYHELKDRLDARGKDYYWVSTRSEQGKALLKKYVVEDVPSMLYIYPNGRGHAVASLHETDPATGKTIIPPDVFDYMDDIETRASAHAFDAELDDIPSESNLDITENNTQQSDTQPAVQLIWQFLSPEDALYALFSDSAETQDWS